MAQIAGVFRLGRDAEVRYTQGGDAVTNLALAFNYGKKDADGKRPVQWIDAILWGKRAEALSPYLKTGGQIYALLGDPRIETYSRNDGGQGVKLVANVLEVELVGSRQDNGAQPSQRPQQSSAPQRNAYADAKGTPQPAQQRQHDGFEDDQIPF